MAGTINFFLKKPRLSGRSLIVLRWKYSGFDLIFSTAQSIAPKNWNNRKQVVKSNIETTSSGEVHLNEYLTTLKSVLQKSYNSELKTGIPTPDVLRKYLNDFVKQHIKKAEPENSLWQLITRFRAGEIRDKHGKSKTAGTLRTYGIVAGHLKTFEKTHKYKLTYDSINRTFLDRYLNYLEFDAKLSINTRSKNLQILKVFLNEAHERGYTDNTFYKKISVAWEESEAVALSRREIKLLYDYDFSDNDRLERVRDLFVFGCNVGLRISDFSRIQPHHIFEKDGGLRIKIQTQKTGGVVEIPCNDQVVKILKKYDYRLPKISDQKFNLFVKEACKIAGLTQTGRLLKEPEKPLFEAIASHTCRRSFCTNLYNEGVPAMVIMRISGHKSESAFIKYIKISQTDAADKLSAHFRKLKESKLVAV